MTSSKDSSENGNPSGWKTPAQSKDEPFEKIKKSELKESFTVIHKDGIPPPDAFEENYGAPVATNKWNIFAGGRKTAADKQLEAD